MKKYIVVLSYFKNFHDVELEYYDADTIEECSRAVRTFIMDNLVGAREWQGGQVYENQKHIGTISYNGKYFAVA